MARRTVLAALLIAGSMATQATAGQRVSCGLLRDVTGDTGQQEQVAPGSTSDVDIVSGDVATNAKYLTAAIRVRDFATSDPTASLEGRTYEFYFSAGREAHFSLVATLGSPRSFVLYRHSAGWTNPEDERPGMETVTTEVVTGKVAGTVDVAHDEVRMTVPLSVFRLGPGGIRKGTELYDMAAYSTRTVGDFDGSPLPSDLPAGAHPYVHPGNPWDVVNGTRDARYPTGARSCVPVGR